ncbi:MAG: hypothetical protein U5M23_03145 [Marinagarivorans sp.]|nr:hypothetical protein [Marinagarivorans sp.]
MKPTTIRLTTDTIHRIEALVGNRRLALFIREAVENELQRREKSGSAQGCHTLFGRNHSSAVVASPNQHDSDVGSLTAMLQLPAVEHLTMKSALKGAA